MAQSTRRACCLWLPVILTTALTSGLIAGALSTPASAATAPVPTVHYTFDADNLASSKIVDSSGNGLDATLVNGATAQLVAGASTGGQALDLPGGASVSNGAYVVLPRKTLEGATDLTVSVRIRWYGTPGDWQWIYALGKDTSRYLFSTPSNGDGRLRTAVTNSYAGGEAQVTGYAALPANTWKTLTVTLDTTARRLTTYLDGAAVASATTSVSAAQLIDATTTNGGYIGKSFYPDPLFAGAIDDFSVFQTAMSEQQVSDLVGTQAATSTSLSRNSFDIRTFVGTAPTLPAAVRATFTDGYDRDLPIAWDPVTADQYAKAGVFTVSGSAQGRAVSATVTVIRNNEIHFDLAKDTGAFHGGASGALYGLYGDGLPTNNLIDGMGLRTVATKAQDGPQHPGADALEVVKPLADSTNGDVYIYMTDIHRGFPYEWPGNTPEEKMDLYKEKITKQVDQVLKLAPNYQDHIVFVPFNEPEGNMFGTGPWSYNGVSWLNNPTDYFRSWDEVYALIKGKMPKARIAGPNTSQLFGQVKGFLQHALTAATVPDVITWHELSHPEQVRSSVATYRTWEKQVFAGTQYEGRQLPINLDEYAFNYHTSVPGQMIQWVSAIEDSKVDADIAYWNIDGNLSDSAVQANRANGQWWLYNAYSSMTGHTVQVSPPLPGQNYTLQGVATLDEQKSQARAIFGGASGTSWVQFDNVPATMGGTVHAWIREIPWTGQIGDSEQPQVITDTTATVTNGRVSFDFGTSLPTLKESSAYEIVLSPTGQGTPTAVPPYTWEKDYEAEAAKYTGTGYSKNGPEGSAQNVSNFYTSGGYDVGGLRTGSNGVLDFTVNVPQDGKYDLSVFANSLNTYNLVRQQGPTNVFLRVDGGAEQEIFLPLGYKWLVWDHADTTVRLSAGTHTISLAAQSLDGTGATMGDAIIDRLHLALPNVTSSGAIYEAELADLNGSGKVIYTGLPKAMGSVVSGAGAVTLAKNGSATFWVYSSKDDEATLSVDMLGSGMAQVSVNGENVLHATGGECKVAVSLSGGINKVTVTGQSPISAIDRIRVERSIGHLATTDYEAERAELTGTARPDDLSQASGGLAVQGVGGQQGNNNKLVFHVTAGRTGTYAMRVRYSNPEQSPATHYNPDPLARPADISVSGGVSRRVLFPHSFHQNNFWVLTIPVRLTEGNNTVTFSSEELPNFDRTTFVTDTFPGILLRSHFAPLIDKISLSEFSTPMSQG